MLTMLSCSDTLHVIMMKIYFKGFILYTSMDGKVVIMVEYKKCKVVSYGHQIYFENYYYLQSDGLIIFCSGTSRLY